MRCFTFYKGVFTPEQLRDYLNANGELPECEMFKTKREGDDERIKDAGFIAEETCDEEIWEEIPATLLEALGELPLEGKKFTEPSINQRMFEMIEQDRRDKITTSPTYEDYLKWAIEEFDANHDDYIKMAEEEQKI